MPSDTTKPDADEGSSTTASGTSTTTSRKASKAGKASATADEKAASGSATRADEPSGGRGDDQSGRNGGARHGRTARKADQAVPTAGQGGPKDGHEGTKVEDLKDRFRAALQRKQSRTEVNTGYLQGEPKVHEVHGATGRRRQFRRKSG